MIHRTTNHVQAWTELGRGIRQRHEVFEIVRGTVSTMEASEARSIDSLHALRHLFVLNVMMSRCDDACLPGIEHCRATGYPVPHNDDDTLLLTSSVAHQHMLTFIQHCNANSQNHMHEHQATLADAAADTRTASRSQHKPTHALGHSLCIGIQPCRPRAATFVRVASASMCHGTARACARCGRRGRCGAGAAHATSSRHMLVAGVASSSPAESFNGV